MVTESLQLFLACPIDWQKWTLWLTSRKVICMKAKEWFWEEKGLSGWINFPSSRRNLGHIKQTGWRSRKAIKLALWGWSQRNVYRTQWQRKKNHPSCQNTEQMDCVPVALPFNKSLQTLHLKSAHDKQERHFSCPRTWCILCSYINIWMLWLFKAKLGYFRVYSWT